MFVCIPALHAILLPLVPVELDSEEDIYKTYITNQNKEENL
jgi:hypothetical protein